MQHFANGRASRQRGVVLIFTLIVLLILMIGAVALMRSMQTSLFGIGNLAFRHDLVNQGEQAVSNVMTAFMPGGILTSSTVSDNDLLTANYKATILTTNQQGVPNALLVNDTAFAAYGQVSNDIPGATPDVQIRYVIDRMCSISGAASNGTCAQSTSACNCGTHNRNTGNSAGPAPTATVYRLSVRVSGARNTQVFLQTTITKPD